MAILSYKNVGISAMAACVPKRIIDNYHYSLDIWSEAEIKKVVDKKEESLENTTKLLRLRDDIVNWSEWNERGILTTN